MNIIYLLLSIKFPSGYLFGKLLIKSGSTSWFPIVNQFSCTFCCLPNSLISESLSFRKFFLAWRKLLELQRSHHNWVLQFLARPVTHLISKQKQKYPIVSFCRYSSCQFHVYIPMRIWHNDENFPRHDISKYLKSHQIHWGGMSDRPFCGSISCIEVPCKSSLFNGLITAWFITIDLIMDVLACFHVKTSAEETAISENDICMRLTSMTSVLPWERNFSVNWSSFAVSFLKSSRMMCQIDWNFLLVSFLAVPLHPLLWNQSNFSNFDTACHGQFGWSHIRLHYLSTHSLIRLGFAGIFSEVNDKFLTDQRSSPIIHSSAALFVWNWLAILDAYLLVCSQGFLFSVSVSKN